MKHTSDIIRDLDIDGIKITINIEVFEDYDFIECMGILADEDLDDAVKLAATIRCFKLALGADYSRVKKELRDKNEGSLKSSDMQGFMDAILKELALKNS